MNTAVLTYVSAAETPVTRFAELDCVRLKRSMESTDGRTVPAGSLGAVIAIWSEGSAYEVEFVEPFQAFVVAPAEDLEAGPKPE